MRLTVLPNPSYIRQTRITIKTQLMQHRLNDANNSPPITSPTNVNVAKHLQDINKLMIYEALTILDRKPDLNRLIDNFINPIKLFARGRHPSTTRTDLYDQSNGLAISSTENNLPVPNRHPLDHAQSNLNSCVPS